MSQYGEISRSQGGRILEIRDEILLETTTVLLLGHGAQGSDHHPSTRPWCPRVHPTVDRRPQTVRAVCVFCAWSGLAALASGSHTIFVPNPYQPTSENQQTQALLGKAVIPLYPAPMQRLEQLGATGNKSGGGIRNA